MEYSEEEKALATRQLADLGYKLLSTWEDGRGTVYGHHPWDAEHYHDTLREVIECVRTRA